jgi:4-hydroxy-3-methylbut-2-enyl diphosphate reductase
MEVILAEYLGFCYGVKRAIRLARDSAAEEDASTLGPIIHNPQMVAHLEEEGVGSVDSLDEVPDGGTLIIRSHGVGPAVYEAANSRPIKVVDATCPFVKKIHRIVEAENAKGNRVVIVGDPHHPEVEGIRGWGREDTAVIESAEDLVRQVPDRAESLSIVSQTTYKLSKFNKIVADCINLGYHIFCFNTICNATQERQSEAQEIASDVDAMIVIGGRSSSNTRKLAEICSHECKKTFFIQTAADLVPGCLARCGRIGITAGASTPKHIIEEVQTIVGSEF